jgi:hypothetical protein
MRPHIIGVAGPSSSGKTELSRQLAACLPGTSIVSLDSYYRGMKQIPLEQRKRVNFDSPDALDWELLHEHLQLMAAGRAFEEPVYSFAAYSRTPETKRVESGEFVIVEGLFVLYWPELRATGRNCAGCWTPKCMSGPIQTSAFAAAWRGTLPNAAVAKHRFASNTSAPCGLRPNGSSIPRKNTPTSWSLAKSPSPGRPPRWSAP